MSSLAARLCTFLLLAALVGFAPVAAADPEDSDPDLAKRDQDYAAGKAAADRKDWAAAIVLYERAEKRHPGEADLQNSLGYAYRNLKQLDLAFRHYKRAIQLDPRHRGAHEYIGEAYLMTGDLKSAEQHLAVLRNICLLPCEELQDLEREIARYKGAKWRRVGLGRSPRSARYRSLGSCAARKYENAVRYDVAVRLALTICTSLPPSK